jgi:hypothetical protein
MLWEVEFIFFELQAYKISYIHVECKMKEKNVMWLKYGCQTPWYKKCVSSKYVHHIYVCLKSPKLTSENELCLLQVTQCH